MRTPGKWKAHGCEVVSESGILLATAGTRYHPTVEERLEERESNAEIMALAPDLLELCEAVLNGSSAKSIVGMARAIDDRLNPAPKQPYKPTELPI